MKKMTTLALACLLTLTAFAADKAPKAPKAVPESKTLEAIGRLEKEIADLDHKIAVARSERKATLAVTLLSKRKEVVAKAKAELEKLSPETQETLRAEKAELAKTPPPPAPPVLTPAQKKVQEKKEKEAKRASDARRANAREEFKALVESGVSGSACKTIWVEPAVTKPKYNNIRLVITNTSPTLINEIRDSNGQIVVRGLCPMETVSIIKSLPYLRDKVEFIFTAHGEMNGVALMDEKSGSVNRVNRHTMDTLRWKVKLRPE